MALLKCRCIACKKDQYAGYRVYCDDCHTHICRNIESKGTKGEPKVHVPDDLQRDFDELQRLKTIAATALAWHKEAVEISHLGLGSLSAANRSQALLIAVRDAKLGGVE